MIKKETINGTVYLEQTTYYIYGSEEDWKKDLPAITMSSRKEFNRRKKNAKEFKQTES